MNLPSSHTPDSFAERTPTSRRPTAFRWTSLLGLLLVAIPAWTQGASLPLPRLLSTHLPTPPVASTSSPLVTAQVLDGRSVLSVIHTQAHATSIHLLTLTHPPTTRPRYALTGEVSYAHVQGEAYLEMWSHFPGDAPNAPTRRFFSRTLAPSGRLGLLEGSSGWRGFELPFDATGATGAPVKLELNLVLPGPGTVHLSPCSLVEYDGAWPWSFTSPADAWWDDRVGGWIGGIAGLLYGGLGGLFGWLAGKGRAQAAVTAGMRGLIALGAVTLVAGAAAYFQHQPYAVWYPLVLTGILSLAIMPYGLRQANRHYQARDLHRSHTSDAGDS